MSIRKKIEETDLTISFIHKLENTLFDLLDDDDPVNIYMLTDLCKQLKIDFQECLPLVYQSGHYNLKNISKGDFETVINITEALYDTCLRFQKFDLALIVSTEVTRALHDANLNLNWVDGKFIDKNPSK